MALQVTVLRAKVVRHDMGSYHAVRVRVFDDVNRTTEKLWLSFAHIPNDAEISEELLNVLEQRKVAALRESHFRSLVGRTFKVEP